MTSLTFGNPLKLRFQSSTRGKTTVLHTKKKAPELPEPTDRLAQASPRWVVKGQAMRQGIDREILVILEVSGYFNLLKKICHLKNSGGIVVILEVFGIFQTFMV